MIKKNMILMVDSDGSSSSSNKTNLNLNNEEELKRKQEEETQKKIDAQKKKERNNINSALNKVEDGFDEIRNKLTLAANILSDDITLDNVGFHTEEIKSIKRLIDSIDK